MAKAIRDHLTFEISMAYGLTRQHIKRGFGGSAPGKGRQLRVIPHIASAVAARIDYAMTFGPATVSDLERVIFRTMDAISPADAYETVVRDVNRHEAARRVVIDRIADDLLQDFQFEKKAFTGLHPITAASYPPGFTGTTHGD